MLNVDSDRIHISQDKPIYCHLHFINCLKTNYATIYVPKRYLSAESYLGVFLCLALFLHTLTDSLPAVHRNIFRNQKPKETAWVKANYH